MMDSALYASTFLLGFLAGGCTVVFAAAIVVVFSGDGDHGESLR
jgi:hypothetical protein